MELQFDPNLDYQKTSHRFGERSLSGSNTKEILRNVGINEIVSV